MAIILGPPPPLETLLLSLQPPSFLPPTDDEGTNVLPFELASWHALLAQTLAHLTTVLDDQDEHPLKDEEKLRLSEMLSRWSVGHEESEGWVMGDREVREGVEALLGRLPPPSLASLRPTFTSHSPAPPTISTTSFRPLARPVVTTSVVPEHEPWKENTGWGCWNVLRRAVEGCENRDPPPLPLLLPPLLTLLDDHSPATRLQGLVVVATFLKRYAFAQEDPVNARGWGGKWLVQTGIGELLLKSLTLTLHLPNSPLSPHILLLSLSNHLLLSTLLYPPNSRQRTEATDELIEKGIVGTWVYRDGGEEGECARVVAEWLSEGELMKVLGGLGGTRVLGTLLPSLLLPLTTLSPTSPRPTVRPFLLALLRAVHVVLSTSLHAGPERVAAWRGKVLGGLGRLWVAIKEGEMLEGSENESLVEVKLAVFSVLVLLGRASEAFENDLSSLVELDRKVFGGLLEGWRKASTKEGERDASPAASSRY